MIDLSEIKVLRRLNHPSSIPALTRPQRFGDRLVRSLDIKAFRIELRTNPTPIGLMAFVLGIGPGFKEIGISARAADIFGRT